MPRRKSYKPVIIELMIYVGMFSIAAHLCENLCERFMMHSNINDMKSELISLGVTINNIEMAYDSLREEIQDLASDNHELTTSHHKRKFVKDPNIKQSYSAYIQNKPKDYIVQNMLTKFIDGNTYFMKDNKDFMQKFGIPAKNKSITGSHLKNIDVTDNVIDDEHNWRDKPAPDTPSPDDREPKNETEMKQMELHCPENGSRKEPHSWIKAANSKYAFYKCF